MTKVKSQVDRSFKILVSSGKAGQITCIGFQRDETTSSLKPISIELEAGDLSIPDGAELLSLDTFQLDDILLLGFCFTKEDTIDNNTIQWLNASNIISTQLEPGADFTVAGLMQGLSSVELDFNCLFLKHRLIKQNGMTVHLCLMSGDDSKVHLFTLEREDFGNTIKCCEVSCEIFFPEFKELESCVICLDFLEIGDKRISAIGCDNGSVLVFVVDLKSLHILESWKTRHDHPIIVVKLFSNMISPDSKAALEICHLLASSVTTTSVVYRNILQNGFTNVKSLYNSNSHDLVMCACVADIDWDGEPAIILGTNGHCLLAYKWYCEDKTTLTIQTSDSPGQDAEEEEDDLWLPMEEYRLTYIRKFSHPLMGLEYVDMTGDGVCELVILCSDGVRILQHNLEKAKNEVMERLKKFKTVKDDDNK
ncbi:KICSTOR complex protein kaptin-like isoform X2 [Antedon mediterranea]